MGRSYWIAFVILLGIPTFAQADCEEARALRGRVESVVVSEGQLFTDTGAPRGNMTERQKWAFSLDKRTITITHYDSPVPSVSYVWATTVCEFDDSGRLLSSRWKPDGMTVESTEERTYDEQGRLVMVKSDDMPDRVLTYTYSGNAKTARHPAHNPITSTTERDSSGRIIRETRQDEGEKQGSVVEYRYGPGTKEVIGIDHDNKFHYISKLDEMGNTISSTNVTTGETVINQFEYDSQGNWTKRVQPSPPTKISRVVVRQIAYYP